MNLMDQAATFGVMVVTGALLGFIFDCYRVARGIVRPRWLLTSFGDLLYWLVATLTVFTALMLSNWGELRFYIFIGLLIGACGYCKFCSRYIIVFLWRFVRVLSRVLCWLKMVTRYVLIWPFMRGIQLILTPFTLITNKILRWCTWKNRLTNNKPPPET